jgi:hypothetical protein
MKSNEMYIDVDGDSLSLAGLDAEERRLVERLRRRAGTHPDWTEFDNYWMREVAAFYDGRRVPRVKSRHTIPYRIAQDLSARLGIAQGYIQPPGPFDDLEEMILSKYGSLHAFCKATGIPEKELDAFRAGRGDLSLVTLLKGLEKIGYRLRITPAAPPMTVKQPRTKNKRAARSA